MDNWKSPKVYLAVLLIVAVAAVAIISILRDRIVNQPQWQVSVVGQGKIAYQPDIANITLGVQIDKLAKAEDALNQLNEKMGKVVAAMKAAGVAAEDIQTQNYSLYPQYEAINDVSGAPNPSGYSANQLVLVKARGIDQDSGKVSQVVAEATKAGANQVVGVSFDLAGLEEIKQEARTKAINDARQKAGVLAVAAGVRLGQVVGWWENLIQAPGSGAIYYDGKGGVGGAGNVVAAPTIPTGTQEVIMEVNLSYRIR